MRSIESLFNDSHWEVRIPNARIDSLSEDYKAVIQAKPRTHTVLFFLQISLPDDLSTQHDETAKQVQEFFKTLEIQVEAAFVDSLSLVASAPTAQNTMYKSPNSSRPNSAVDKRMSQQGGSPGPGPFGGRNSAGYDQQGRMDSTILSSYAYNASEPGKEPEIRPVNGLWTAIFPFSVPVSFVRTKSANTMLMLSAHVLLRPADQIVPVAVPMDDQYNLECFSMVNLLEGLSDDPNFISSVVPQHHYRPDTPRARVQPPLMAPVLRRSVRRTIAVRSALNVRMRTTRVSPMENPLMMSIEVENNSEHGAKFKMTQLEVDVTNAVVTPLDSAELTKLPMVLHSSDHVTFLFSISLLDNPEWNADNQPNGNDPYGGRHRNSSENLAQAGSSRDAQRQVTIILQGTPEVDGVQGQVIHSRWNCFLDVSDLTKRDNSLGAAGPIYGNSMGGQKQLYAPQPSHPSTLLPPHSTSGPSGQNNQQYQLHHRNQSLPSSPQPQAAMNKGTSLVRRVSSSASPSQNGRQSMGASGTGEPRARRSSLISEGAPGSQRGALGSANRKSSTAAWGYGRSENSQGLAPVQEGSSHPSHSPRAGNGPASATASYEDDAPHGPVNNNSGRPAMNQGGLSPGLGIDMASQALNGVTQGRPDQDSGDGIVVSFAVTDRVVVGKIFNLEIFIVNRSRHIRRYTLVVPNRKRAKGGDPSQGSKVLPPLPSGEMVLQNVPIDPYMEETELLRRHVDNETTEADIICLENNVRLSPLYPLTCQNLNLRFIAIKEQLHTIDLVQLVDNDTGFVTNLRNCLCFMAEASFGALSQQVPETHQITAALLLAASSVQALEPAFGPHFGVSYIYDIVNSVVQDAVNMVSKPINKYNKTETNFFVRVGTNGIGNNGTPVPVPSDGSSGMDGPFPLIDVFDKTGTLISSAVSRKPYLDSGKYSGTGSSVVFGGAAHYRVKVTAGDDGTPSTNADCISSIAVSPDDKSGSPTYALTSEVIIALDSSVPWYYSGQESFAHTPSNDCHPIRIPSTCFWLSQFVKKEYTPVYSIELSNIPDYVFRARSTDPVPRLPDPASVKITRAVRPQTETTTTTAATAKQKRKRAALVVGTEEFDYVNSGPQSARFLCESPGSFGPSFLSTVEKLYCDMVAKVLFSECKSVAESGCYRVVDSVISVISKPAQTDEGTPQVPTIITLNLRLFGSDSGPMLNLRKRAECVKGTAKTALNVGETLAMTDYLSSTEGSYRLVVLPNNGDLIVYDSSRSDEPSSIAIWSLGANGPRDTYVAELNANGQLCSRSTAGVVLKCVGPKSAPGPPYQLTVSKTGSLYFKNGVTVVWTTDPQVTATPHEIDGTPLTESNSFASLQSTFGPKLLTSTNGATTLEFKDGTICLYNSLKYRTWCLDKPAGDNPNVWFTLTSRGSICILRTTGGPLSSSCTGNAGAETSYFAVLHDDGFLKVYNSAEQLVWQRGGGHSFNEGNTLRAGGFKLMSEEIKSTNGQYSLQATETGGLVLRKNADSSIVWQLGGGLVKGDYTIEMGLDANLCVGTASVHSRVSCISGTARPEDQYVLVVEDDGHVAVWASDGQLVWRS
ncbi:hypothetical protein BGX33_008827 [Mortierella sp. NVP41]|nr:hypothetical protein BGX33_008827 [Mortierella sp. NVP41]